MNQWVYLCSKEYYEIRDILNEMISKTQDMPPDLKQVNKDECGVSYDDLGPVR